MKSSIRKITTVAVIAAAYTALTYMSASLGLAYGALQVRLSEPLMVLALFSPEAVFGLALGCLLGNIASPLGFADMLFGTAATLIAGFAIRGIASRCQNDLAKCLLVSVFTTLINAIVIGAEILFVMIPEKASLTLFLLNAGQIAVGEAMVCLAMCFPLLQIIKNNKCLFGFFNNPKKGAKG